MQSDRSIDEFSKHEHDGRDEPERGGGVRSTCRAKQVVNLEGLRFCEGALSVYACSKGVRCCDCAPAGLPEERGVQRVRFGVGYVCPEGQSLLDVFVCSTSPCTES